MKREQLKVLKEIQSHYSNAHELIYHSNYPAKLAEGVVRTLEFLKVKALELESPINKLSEEIANEENELKKKEEEKNNEQAI